MTQPSAERPESAPPVGALRRFLAGFQRITTSGAYIPEIDGLRFIAIAAVIIYHCGMFVMLMHDRPVALFELGGRGVELFFAISGFVLAAPFVSQYVCNGPRVTLGKYFLRRITRLEPPYLLALLMAFVVRIVITNEPVRELLPFLGASALYLHEFVFGTSSLILVVAWSLEIEVQFYILMPLLALLFLIRPTILRRAIVVAAMMGSVMCQRIDLHPLLYYIAHPTGPGAPPLIWWQHIGNFIQFFLAGILLADIYIVSWKGNPAAARWGDVVWLIGWPTLAWSLTHLDHLWARLAFPALVFLLYFALFKSTIARRCMSLPVICIIGGMCYSIYLTHLMLIQVFGLMLQPMLLKIPYLLQFVVNFAVMIPLILVICGLFFRLIERPCMRRDWPRRFWGWFLGRLLVDDGSPANLP